MIFLGKEVHSFGEPFIVAEISGNHYGKFNTAIELIDAAKWANADAVKIQCYDADDLTLNNGYVIVNGTPWEGKTLYELYQEAHTPKDWIEPLFEHAKKIGIPIFISVYSEKGLELLEKLGCLAYKIASYEANDPYFISRVASKGRPIVLSTGMLGDDELNRAINHCPDDQTILLHCVSKYPVEIDQLGLSNMNSLRGYNGNYPVGFSCHSDNPAAIMAAVANGAAMVEVHLVLEGDSIAPDYEFSMLPNELKWSIDAAKKIYKSNRFKDDSIEYPAREFRRSIHLVADIAEGETITKEHLRCCRPSTGCAPHLFPNIIGRKVNRDLKAMMPMQMEYLV